MGDTGAVATRKEQGREHEVTVQYIWIKNKKSWGPEVGRKTRKRGEKYMKLFCWRKGENRKGFGKMENNEQTRLQNLEM